MNEDRPKKYERHPLSAIWGDMDREEYRELVDSVESAHGVIDYVVTLYEERVLDGYHRYCAALDAGKADTLVFSEYAGSDPVGFVIAKNAYRRQLNAGQRAAAILECYAWRDRGNPQFRNIAELEPPTTQDVARQAGVSPRTVEHTKVALRSGLGEEVKSGRMSAAAAAEVGRMTEPGQPSPAPEKEPNRLTKVQQLRLQFDEALQKIEDLEEEVRFFRGEVSDLDHDREAMFNRQREQIRTLNSQVRTWQTRHNEEKRRAGYWEQQARGLGWESGMKADG